MLTSKNEKVFTRVCGVIDINRAFSSFSEFKVLLLKKNDGRKQKLYNLFFKDKKISLKHFKNVKIFLT